MGMDTGGILEWDPMLGESNALQTGWMHLLQIYSKNVRFYISELSRLSSSELYISHLSHIILILLCLHNGVLVSVFCVFVLRNIR